MSPKQQRIAVAKVFGWEPIAEDGPPYEDESWWRHPVQKTVCAESCLPDYTTDLNAIHQVEQILSEDDYGVFTLHLIKVVERTTPIEYPHFIVRATAAQRAEALLRALNLWED
jgi:hypothetical protein